MSWAVGGWLVVYVWLQVVWLAWVAVGLCYIGSVWWSPRARCMACWGKKRKMSRNGKTWHRCLWCRGSGERLRIGARMWGGIDVD